jgi:SAM-dependent methyltransferase
MTPFFERKNAAMVAPNPIHYDIPYEAEKQSALLESEDLELQRSVAAFFTLAYSRCKIGSLNQRIVMGIHRMLTAIQKCEAAGMQPREIRDRLMPARILHHRSKFVARAQDWPRGYQGDFETIEYLCDGLNHVSVNDVVGYGIEEYALNSRICQQHRNKVQLQADLILKCCRSKKAPRVLSLGCGGARDLRMIGSLLENSDAEFVLCDSDPDALEFARAQLGVLADRSTFVHGKVPRVVNRLKSLGKFDLVVAGGLFDYLPDRWIELMLSEIWRGLLNEHGQLFFTNIAVDNPYRVWMEYLADWSLIERSEKDIERLCRDAGIDDCAISITRDETNLALMISVHRSATIRGNLRMIFAEAK